MLKNILLYILQKSKLTLNKARITKLVYLIDWKSSLDRWIQATDIEWYFDHYWPFVKDIDNILQSDSNLFEINQFVNGYNPASSSPITTYKAKLNTIPNLDPNLKSTIDFVLDKTDWLEFQDFVDFIYSTYPIVVSEKYSYLNLINLAKEYKQQKSLTIL